MIVVALAAVALAALLVAVMMPREALAGSHALGRRADGSESAVRTAREAGHRRRVWKRGVIYPVAAVAALAAAGVLADIYTPWTRLALVFGTATSETALLSETQVERVRQQEARNRLLEESREDVPLAPPPGRGDGLMPFLLEHWPLRPLWLLALAVALWRVYRHAAATHAAYDTALRARHREYVSYDLSSHDKREPAG